MSDTSVPEPARKMAGGVRIKGHKDAPSKGDNDPPTAQTSLVSGLDNPHGVQEVAEAAQAEVIIDEANHQKEVHNSHTKPQEKAQKGPSKGLPKNQQRQQQPR